VVGDNSLFFVVAGELRFRDFILMRLEDGGSGW
jgi:hypothetical protein